MRTIFGARWLGPLVVAVGCDTAPDGVAQPPVDEPASARCESSPALGAGFVQLSDAGGFEVDGEEFVPQGHQQLPAGAARGRRSARRAGRHLRAGRGAGSLHMGVLPWMIGERNRMDHDGYLIMPEDVATLDVLRCD